ncbi:MAG: hypothetical protein Kow0069_20580 [Promethearchaeota archaeon]
MVMQVALDALLEDLVDSLGERRVSSSGFALASYSEDASPLPGKMPRVVARPETTEQVVAVVRAAARWKVPVVPTGGRTSISGAPVPRVDGALALDLTGMDALLSLDEDAQVVTVQAGVTWSGLIHQLRERGYRLGFRGPYGGNAGTVGGSLSVNSIGCGSARHGGAADSVVGLEVVLASGEVLATGSGWRGSLKGTFARNVTFNDLTGVFLGDHGTLGVKTAATLKVFPLAGGTAFADFGFSDVEHAAAALHEVQRHHLAEEAVMLGDANSVELMAETYRSTHPDAECILAVVVEEHDRELADLKRDRVAKIARRHGGRDVGTFLAKAHWHNKFNLVQPLFEAGFWHNTCHVRTIGTLPLLVGRFHDVAERHRLEELGVKWIISALGTAHCFSSGWITLFVPTRAMVGSGPEDELVASEAKAAWGELLDAAIELGGVPYWTGPLWESRALAAVDPSFHETMRRVKDALDPQHLFHPLVFGLSGGSEPAGVDAGRWLK